MRNAYLSIYGVIFVMLMVLSGSDSLKIFNQCSIPASTSSLCQDANTRIPAQPSATSINDKLGSIEDEPSPGEIENVIAENLRLILSEPSDSSSPYVYTQNNPYYKNIVNLGTHALVHIPAMIDRSESNGIEEYILAIAAEEIAKVHLKGKNCKWANAKEWICEWNKHLKMVPYLVDAIVAKNTDLCSKNRELVELGVPAIPYIIDKIEQGRTDLVPAIDELLRENQAVTLEDNKKINYGEWVRDNKSKFEDIRNMVEKVR